MVRVLAWIGVVWCLCGCTPAGVVAAGTVAAAFIDGYCSSAPHSRSTLEMPVCRPPEVLR